MNDSPEGDFSNVSSELSIAQDEDHEADANGNGSNSAARGFIGGRKFC